MGDEHARERQEESPDVPTRATPSPSTPGLATTAGNAALTHLIEGPQTTTGQGLPTQGAGPLDEQIWAAIQSRKGAGSPLSPSLRGDLESSFGTDLSAVRLHTDSAADQLNRSVQAVAFTAGRDIFFSSGAYEPTAPRGRELIAHEITHTIQQSTGVPDGGPTVSRPDDAAEVEAAEIAKAVVRGSDSE